MSPVREAAGIFFTALPATLLLLGQLLLPAVAALGWGRLLVGRGFSPNAAEHLGLSLAAGLTALGMALFGIGLMGLIGAVAVGVLVGVGVGLAWWQARDVLGAAQRLGPIRGGALLLVTLFVATLLAYPLTGWDPAMYRLPTARAFAESGGLPFVPELRFPVGPQLGEVLLAGALTLANDHLARGLVFLAFLGTAALLGGWGRRQFGTLAGLAAAALFVGSPGAVLYGTDAYVDVLQGFFTLAALAMTDLTRSEGNDRASFAAGALAGASAATRYTGLLAAVVVPLALYFTVPKARRRRALLLASAGALAVAAPWYLRAAILTGNPLFPLLTGVFGPNEWSIGSFSALYGTGEEGALAFLARLTLRPAEGPPMFNPWLAVLLPLALWGAWREPRLRWPVGLGLGLGLAVWAIAPDPRFLLPALAPLALGVGGAAARLWPPGRFLHGGAALGLALTLAAPGLLYTGYRLSRLGPVPTQPPAVRRFLTREIRGYAAVAELNRSSGVLRTVYAFHGERLRFYARDRWLGDTSGPYRWELIEPLVEDPARLARVLRGFGADLLLWVRVDGPEPAWTTTGTPELRKIYADAESWIYALSPLPLQTSASAPATSARISGVE